MLSYQLGPTDALTNHAAQEDIEQSSLFAAPVVSNSGAAAIATRVRMERQAVQMHGGSDCDASVVQDVASRGVSGSGESLPHADAIQRSFGRHDVSGIESHTGGLAASAASAIGADAYATGNKVAFGSAPDLRLAAHEAAHVVQQRGGVQLSSGVGAEGDVHEQNADDVADRVVRGESAEDLLDPLARAGSDAASQGHVQRYTKRGDTRISDNKHIVVVETGAHNQVYVSPGVFTAGVAGMKDDSKVEFERGAAFNPRDFGLRSRHVGVGLQLVKVKQKASDEKNRQTQGAIRVSTSMSQGAQAQMDKLAKPTTWQKIRGKTRDVDISQVDPDRDILGVPAIKNKVSAIYLEIAQGARDFSPKNVDKVAKKHDLPRKIRYFIQNAMQEYHQRVLNEYENGGMTTPNDCGETAKNFVRGQEIRATTGGGEGYPYHFFSMPFVDGSDQVSLENAVGGNHLEQIWKQGAFDADWSWIMRGTNRPVGDEEVEEHGLGDAKTTPGENMRNMQMGARLNVQDTLG